MMTISIVRFAIVTAKENGTLRVEKQWSDRFKEYYWVISDNYGIISTALDEKEARELVR